VCRPATCGQRIQDGDIHGKRSEGCGTLGTRCIKSKKELRKNGGIGLDFDTIDHGSGRGRKSRL